MSPERLPRHLLDAEPRPTIGVSPLAERIACHLRSHLPYMVTSSPKEVTCGRCLLIARRRRLLTAREYRQAVKRAAAPPEPLPKPDPLANAAPVLATWDELRRKAGRP